MTDKAPCIRNIDQLYVLVCVFVCVHVCAYMYYSVRSSHLRDLGKFFLCSNAPFSYPSLHL